MLFFKDEDDLKKFLEDSIKSAERWINYLEEQINRPIHADNTAASLKQWRAWLAKWQEEYGRRYAKSETKPLTTLKLIQGGLRS